MTNGTKKWSTEHYFYASIGDGIASNNTLSFKIWMDFTTATKEAIHYSTIHWTNALGREAINTYAYNQGVTSATLNNNDNINTVIPIYDDEANSALMTAYWRISNQKIVEVDITINKIYPWANNTSTDYYNVQNVITHEMGHALGLTDKYEDFASEWTMKGSSNKGETKKTTLHEFDIQALKRLYNII